MSDLSDLQKRVLQFRDDRNWKQFHNPKDLAISLVDEAVELLNEFKWKSDAEIAEHVETNPNAVADELMDVLYHVLLISADLGVDIPAEFERKMQKNEKKYPTELVKGKHSVRKEI